MTNPNPNEARDFLMGSGVSTLSFDANKGYVMGQTVHRGIVISAKLMQQRDVDTGKPKYWNNGDPVKQLVITLQTTMHDPQNPDDDGQRALYVSSPNMRTAIRDAIKAAGGKDLEPGGELAICWVGNGEQTNKAYNPPKIYKAQWKLPDPGTVDFLGLGSAPSNAVPDPFAGGSQLPPQTQVPQGVHPSQHFANMAAQQAPPAMVGGNGPAFSQTVPGQPGGGPVQQPPGQAAQQATASANNPFVQQVPAETATPVQDGLTKPAAIDQALWDGMNAAQRQAIVNAMGGLGAAPAAPGNEPPF